MRIVMRNEGGGFAEILRLGSQLFWHSLSHMRRFSPLRMTKRGDALKRHIPAFTHTSIIVLQGRFLDFARNDDARETLIFRLLNNWHLSQLLN